MESQASSSSSTITADLCNQHCNSAKVLSPSSPARRRATRTPSTASSTPPTATRTWQWQKGHSPPHLRLDQFYSNKQDEKKNDGSPSKKCCLQKRTIRVEILEAVRELRLLTRTLVKLLSSSRQELPWKFDGDYCCGRCARKRRTAAFFLMFVWGACLVSVFTTSIFRTSLRHRRIVRLRHYLPPEQEMQSWLEQQPKPQTLHLESKSHLASDYILVRPAPDREFALPPLLERKVEERYDVMHRLLELGYEDHDDDLEHEDCVFAHSWQEASFPTCNFLHEQQLQNFINHGDFRDVWRIVESRDSRTSRVLKTLRYEHEFSFLDYQEHRRDALVMERLTASPHVADIYGYCFTSGIFDFSSGGTIENAIWPDDEKKSRLSRMDRLRVAVQVAGALADLHDLGAVAHTDVGGDQFLLLDGQYKLNDFNRCRFLRRHETTNEVCGFHVDFAPGTFRSPEEYRYDRMTEKADLYQMGNIFYTLLTDSSQFQGLERDEAKELILAGDRSEIPRALRHSQHPADVALRHAIDMSQQLDPNDRNSAREIYNYLSQSLLEQFE